MRKLNRVHIYVVSCLLSVGCSQGEFPIGTAAEGLLPNGPDAARQADRGCACTQATGGLWATFQVRSETFQQKITNAIAITDAIAVWRGQSNKHIPVGALRCNCAGWNCRWNFAMDPATLEMAEFAIEMCDGLPSYVNETCGNFGGGHYCPASAIMVDLRDCRTNPACPVVSR